MKEGAVLLVMMEPPATLEDEFNDWYDTEHMPQRLSLPGFRSASRWVCVDGWPRWMALYDMASPQALETPEYLAVSGPRSTPWSRRVLPRTIGRSRVVMVALPSNHSRQAEPTAVSRLLLARYPLHGGTVSAPDLAAELITSLANAGASRTRAFVSTDEAVPNLWITLAFDYPARAEALAQSGRCGAVGATLFNLYLPYRRA